MKKLISQIALSTLVVYLISVPILTLFQTNFTIMTIIVIYLLRPVAIVALGVSFRIKNKQLLAESQTKLASILIFGGLFVWSNLQLVGFTDNMYMLLTYGLGLYETFDNNILIATFLEQIVWGRWHLVTSFFVCSSIVLIKKPSFKNSNDTELETQTHQVETQQA